MANPLRITLAEAQSQFRAQGVDDRDCATICPMCRTIQSMTSLVRAGCSPHEVERYFAFSCEGRFSAAGPWPGDNDVSAEARARRAVRGCNWTLGGFLRIHQFTLVYPDGEERPMFEIATVDQARALRDEMQAEAA